MQIDLEAHRRSEIVLKETLWWIGFCRKYVWMQVGSKPLQIARHTFKLSTTKVHNFLKLVVRNAVAYLQLSLCP